MTATAIITAPPTAQQMLDRIRGLVENGYGPDYLAVAVLVAADPGCHGASVAAIADFAADLDEPVGLADYARELIEDGVLVEGPDGQLAIEPYEDL